MKFWALLIILTACAPAQHQVIMDVKKEPQATESPPANIPASAVTPETQTVVVITNVAPATTTQCSSGGYVLETYTNNVLTSSSLICNDFVEAPIGPMIHGKGYSACHHDLLYLGGWLFLRHQENGTADQGVGETGFNVWNADVDTFSLVSEVGNITYCNLKYDKQNGKLIWTVVDTTDGLKGKTGEIDL